MRTLITGITACVLISFSGAQLAYAGCVDAFMTGYESYQNGARSNQKKFKIDELLVVCFTPQNSGQLAVFDAPADGAYEQLYPNALTHPDGSTYIDVVAGQQKCIGLPDTLPLYHPEHEGTGTGKVSFAFTKSANHQLSGGDFVQLGIVSRNTMESHLNDFKETAGACGEREVIYLHYEVVK